MTERQEEECGGWGWWSELPACHTCVKCKWWPITAPPPEGERLACQRYLLAADDPRREQGLLGTNHLLPLLELRGQRLHLLLLLAVLAQQLLALPVGSCQPLLRSTEVEGEKFLAVEEPLHRELGQLQELHQSRVHRALAPLASLPIQAAEGDRVDVLLKGVHIQLAHHQVDVHCVNPPPVHAFPARAKLEGESGGGSAGRSHAWWRCTVAVCRRLAERGVQQRRDPCWRVGPLGVTCVGVVDSVMKWLQQRPQRFKKKKKKTLIYKTCSWATHISIKCSMHSTITTADPVCIYLKRCRCSPDAALLSLPSSADCCLRGPRRFSSVPPPLLQLYATTPSLGVRRVTMETQRSVPGG